MTPKITTADLDETRAQLDEMRKMCSYVIKKTCLNCGFIGDVTIGRGTVASTVPCPNCGVSAQKIERKER